MYGTLSGLIWAIDMYNFAEELKGSRVLITGGSGFLGTHLIKKLRECEVAELITLQRGMKPIREATGASSVCCDLSRPESQQVIRGIGEVDYVFNLAGLIDQRMPHPNPRELWDANVVTLIHLTDGLDWSAVKGAVHIGTTAEYGNQELPFREDQLLKPTNIYGWSKAAATQYAVMMAEGGYAKWRVARQFTGYGPGQKAGFIFDAASALKRGETFTVNPSYVTRDPIFVADTIEGLIRLTLAANGVGEIVNLCPGKEISLGEIATVIHGIVGKGKIELVQREPRKGDFLRSWGDTKKIERLLGWKPAITLEEGLRITIPTI